MTSSDLRDPYAVDAASYPAGLRSRDGWVQYLEAARSPEPHLHQIEPTNRCPYACIMCPRNDNMTRELGFMDLGLYRTVMEEVATYAPAVRAKEIELFHFGESLLHPRLVDMVSIGADLGLRLTLSVNAPQLTPQLQHRLLAARPYRLIVSLDGHDAETYRRIRGPAADFGKAVRNIEHLIELERDAACTTDLCLRMIRLRANEEQAEAFRRTWEARGITVDLRSFFPWNSPEMADLGRFETYPPYMPCPFPWQYLVVQWNGDVVPCCRDYNGVNAIGNVRDQSLREIWNGDRYRAFREQHRCGDYTGNALCRDCMALYYTEGPRDDRRIARGSAAVPPPVEDVLPAVWQTAVARYAERPFLVDDRDGSVFSYADADELVRALRNRLAAQGIGKGDRVMLWAPAHAEGLLLFWAAAQAGAVFVPIDPDVPPAQAVALVRRVAPALIAADARHAPDLCDADAPVVLLDDVVPAGPEAAGLRISEWLQDEDFAQLPPVPACDGNDPAVLLFTSGTTAAPKGVLLGHAAMAHSGRLMARTYEWQSGDVLFSMGDYHTMSGLRNPGVATVHAGACALVPAPEVRQHPRSLAACAVRHRASILALVPQTMRLLLAGVTDREALAHCRLVLCTGDRLPLDFREAFTERFGVPVCSYYGLTETAGICLAELTPELPPTEGNLGLPVGADIRLEPVPGHDSADGDLGELWVSSRNLMIGYLDDPKATTAMRSGRWLRTGDLVRRHPDGQFSLVARLRHIVKNAYGEIVSPAEIEVALRRIEGVRDAWAGVVGPQDRFAALVVPADGAIAAEWEQTMRRNLLAVVGRKNMPALLRAVAALPRGVNGKVSAAGVAELLGVDVGDRTT